MTTDLLLDAIGTIDDTIILDAKNYHILSEAKNEKKRRTAVLVAAILVALLVTSAFAAAYFSGLLGWFENQWKSHSGQELNPSQVQVINELIADAGQYAEDNGITVTVESILVGATNVRVLLSVEIDGVTLSQDYQYRFNDFFAVVSPTPLEEGAGGDLGVSANFYMVDSAANKAYIVLNYSGSIGIGINLQSGYTMDIMLSDVVMREKNSSANLETYKGNWNISISLDSSVMSEIISIDHAPVIVNVATFGLKEQANIILSEISITASGISFSHDTKKEYSFDIEAVMKDGTVVKTVDGGGYLRPDQKNFARTFNWLIPIDVQELSSIRICDSSIKIS